MCHRLKLQTIGETLSITLSSLAARYSGLCSLHLNRTLLYLSLSLARARSRSLSLSLALSRSLSLSLALSRARALFLSRALSHT